MHSPDVSQTLAAGPGHQIWRAPAAAEILGCALPHLGLGDRLLLRALALLARYHVLSIHGLQHIRAAGDPFILAANHGTRRESLLVPALLFLHRGGRRVHFLADWNFRLIPGVGLIYSRAQVVTVLRKSARPRFLNALKPLYECSLRPFEQARAHLVAGRSIGIFPEGAVNRDPGRLLRGRRGAARLSLETGTPVVPMGIRFPHVERGAPIPSHAAMELHIGPPLRPAGPPRAEAPLAAVTEWHATIMRAISCHSGKEWPRGNADDGALARRPAPAVCDVESPRRPVVPQRMDGAAGGLLSRLPMLRAAGQFPPRAAYVAGRQQAPMDGGSPHADRQHPREKPGWASKSRSTSPSSCLSLS
jgi:1-acyl-sn-glycerol-3-phosphate acyltransferase